MSLYTTVIQCHDGSLSPCRPSRFSTISSPGIQATIMQSSQIKQICQMYPPEVHLHSESTGAPTQREENTKCEARSLQCVDYGLLKFAFDWDHPRFTYASPGREALPSARQCPPHPARPSIFLCPPSSPVRLVCLSVRGTGRRSCAGASHRSAMACCPADLIRGTLPAASRDSIYRSWLRN